VYTHSRTWCTPIKLHPQVLAATQRRSVAGEHDVTLIHTCIFYTCTMHVYRCWLKVQRHSVAGEHDVPLFRRNHAGVQSFPPAHAFFISVTHAHQNVWRTPFSPQSRRFVNSVCVSSTHSLSLILAHTNIYIHNLLLFWPQSRWFVNCVQETKKNVRTRILQTSL